MIRLYFVLLTLSVVITWVAALIRARPERCGVIAVGMFLWILLTGAVAFSGTLQNFDRVPPPIGVLLIGGFVIAAMLAASSYGARLMAAVSLQMIVGFQVFRLGVEIFLWWGVQTRLVPPQMTFEGRNWDVITGLTALPVAWLFSRGTIGRTALTIWNMMGLGLLLNVVTVAVLSFPTRIQQFEPSTRFVATLPYVWLPAVLIPAAWFSHLILFRQLWRSTVITS